MLVRSLLKSERPSGLTQAIIEVGRINKTLYLLNYIDDEDYRRRILTQLNRGESRHAVARAICHGQKGEIRKRYTDGQEDQLGALGLVTNAVVLWNTIYMQAALDHLRAQGETLNDEDIARLSPLCHGHINMLGHYSFTLAELVTKGHLRPLKEASEAKTLLNVSFRSTERQTPLRKYCEKNEPYAPQMLSVRAYQPVFVCTRGARRIRKKSYAKVFRASVRAETSRLPVCGSAARRNRRLG